MSKWEISRFLWHQIYYYGHELGIQRQYVFLVKILSEIIVGLELMPSNVSVIKVFQSFKSLIALRNILLIPLDQPSLCPCLASIQLDKLLHVHQRIGKLEPIEVFLQQIDQLANRWLWFDEVHLKYLFIKYYWWPFKPKIALYQQKNSPKVRWK